MTGATLYESVEGECACEGLLKDAQGERIGPDTGPVEPGVGIEPTTSALRKRRSTTELTRQESASCIDTGVPSRILDSDGELLGKLFSGLALAVAYRCLTVDQAADLYLKARAVMR